MAWLFIMGWMREWDASYPKGKRSSTTYIIKILFTDCSCLVLRHYNLNFAHALAILFYIVKFIKLNVLLCDLFNSFLIKLDLLFFFYSLFFISLRYFSTHYYCFSFRLQTSHFLLLLKILLCLRLRIAWKLLKHLITRMNLHF